METLEVAVATAFTIAIQIGMPVTVLFLIGCLAFHARSARAAPQLRGVEEGTSHEMTLESWERGRSALRHPCWVEKGCPEEKRAVCPAFNAVYEPCWRVTKTRAGHLRACCLSCDRFLSPASQELPK